LIEKFKTHITTNFKELKSKKILVTVSGGLDSVVLLHLLQQLHYNLVIAHCNFKLRGEDADKDEEFVRNLGEKFKIPTEVISFNTKEFAKQNKLSIQEAARKLRYDWFDNLCNQNIADVIVTAHHLNDNLETVLHHLTRGTGLIGLTGIPVKNKNIIRPLLPFSRDEIEKFARKNQISWREDKSNTETKYIRNKIRHQVIPVLQEINPQLLQSFLKTHQHLQNANTVLQQHFTTVWQQITTTNNRIIKVDIKQLSKLTPQDYYLYELFKPFGFTDASEIKKLMIAQSGKLVFSKTFRLLKDRDSLLLGCFPEKEKNSFTISKDKKRFEIDDLILIFKETDFRTINPSDKDKNSVVIDKDLLKFPLTVRKWQKGDYFYPSGMQGKKKLSKFFKDKKLNLFEKENIWLLLSENQIVWVIGMRHDKRFLISDKTKTKIKISVLHSENK